MEKKTFWEQVKIVLTKFWLWIKPYLQKIHQFRKRIWKKYHINKIIVLLGLIIILITSIYLFYIAKTSDVSALKKGIEASTVIYDKDGDEAGRLRGQKGSFVSLDQISSYMPEAVVASEDRRFYQHKGFDLKGIARAVVGVVTHGHITGGGSTLTQQLAKNAFLTQNQTLDRKAKELFLAIEIEKHYSKNDIMEMYLNYAYFGNGVWGVEDAAHKYFGTSAAELTPGQAATLTAMLRNPGLYNPIDQMENAVKYRNVVLNEMESTKALTKEQAEEAKAAPIYLADDFQPSGTNYQYPDYFDAVIAEAIDKYDISDEDLMNKGYKIYTALDQNYQQSMDTTFADDSLFPENAADGTMVQAASIAINPKTGGVQAVEGGRGERATRGFNRATDGRISPGSTMKPLAVYTPALEAGYKPTDMMKDEQLPFYDVHNYDRQYRGEVPMYEALADSLNASAVWMLHQVGIETGAKKVEQFGIPLEKEDHYYGLALGGLTKGTSPEKMAAAYSVFANDGKMHKPHFITKIIDANGKVVVDNTDTKEIRVTSGKVASEMTSMLQGVFSSGTGVTAQPYGYTMAGKTGTTENVNVDEQVKDQWVVGYTPDVVVATWIGFDESSDVHYLTGSSSTGVARVFRDETQKILAQSPGTPFAVADASLTETEDSGGKTKEEWKENVEEIGGKVKEGASYWGEKVIDGAKKTKDKLTEWWHTVTE